MFMIQPIALTFATICIYFSIRIIQTSRHFTSKSSSPSSSLNENANNTKTAKKPSKTIKTMLILGSGGHTTELLSLYKQLDRGVYTPCNWVLGSGDQGSMNKVTSMIKEREKDNKKHKHAFQEIPRPRKLHQSYLSSIPTTISSIMHTLKIYIQEKPELVICNGPGIAVPVLGVVFVHVLIWPVLVILGWVWSLFTSNKSDNSFSWWYFPPAKTIFIESYARVKSQSLTGKIIWFFQRDGGFLVHWPKAKNNTKTQVEAGGIEYCGRLI